MHGPFDEGWENYEYIIRQQQDMPFLKFLKFLVIERLTMQKIARIHYIAICKGPGDRHVRVETHLASVELRLGPTSDVRPWRVSRLRGRVSAQPYDLELSTITTTPPHLSTLQLDISDEFVIPHANDASRRVPKEHESRGRVATEPRRPVRR